jgi:hypothetical protein
LDCARPGSRSANAIGGIAELGLSNIPKCSGTKRETPAGMRHWPVGVAVSFGDFAMMHPRSHGNERHSAIQERSCWSPKQQLLAAKFSGVYFAQNLVNSRVISKAIFELVIRQFEFS